MQRLGGFFLIFASFLVLVFDLVFESSAYAQDRVALVVGNGTYANVTRLANPPNDAADMSAALRELGFEVIAATNVDKVSFDKKVREFASALRHARTALFFYAGHGMQVAGKNYAVPIDAKLESAADLQVETIDIDQVMSVMQADENRVNLVFLDACRDNPLTRSFARALPATRAVSVGSGLTAVDAGRGTLIAFATAPNKVAFDGKGRNSPFTAALLKHIRTPGLDIAFVMRRVTADVETASNGTQVPWVHASLTTDVMLKRGEGATALPLPPIGTLGPAADEITWSLLKDTKDIEQLRRFLQQYPASARRTEVEARIASLGQPVSPLPNNQNMPASTSTVQPPHEPLPVGIAIPPEVLSLVETHPFFANAPPVLVNSYALDSTQDYRWSQGGYTGSSITTSNDNNSIRWLRRGLNQAELNAHTTVGGSSGSSTSTSQTTSVEAANGLISLGSKMLATVNLSYGKQMTTITTEKLLRITNIQGHVFPIEIGNRFSYEQVFQRTFSGFNDEHTDKTSCEVLKQYEAKSFHPRLAG